MQLYTKLRLHLLAFICLPFFAAASGTDSLQAEQNVRDKILNDIRISFDTKNKNTDSTISRLNARLSNLDSLLRTSASARDKLDKILERVQVLEDKQKAVELHELNVYQANYQSAVINLVSMEREIKPLVLFHATEDFFNGLTETSNPTSYDGYKEWFDKFKKYVERKKAKEASFQALSNMLTLSGNISAGVPLTGPIGSMLCNGMATYVSSISHHQHQLREEGERMFTLTATLSQFNNDKDKIETEWDEITKSLGELQVSYDSVLHRNLRLIHTSDDAFTTCFSKENDADRRYIFLSDLRNRSAELVNSQKENNPKDWKENIYYQLVEVQALKMKYGEITSRISEHIDKYNLLIKKYRTDKEIGPRIIALQARLNALKETFDHTFDPKEYRNNVARMYKVM
ncbi:hypothetical protein ACTHGU_21110 [Chitinophagaceae bacterium MMS25-I14]